MSTQQAIRRGILQSFDASSYTANVLIVEATNYELSGVPIATSVDGTSAIAGAPCAVLFFDESNYEDGVVIAIYSQAPSPAPGRVTFVAGAIAVNNATINNGVTQTFNLTGVNGIPNDALGVIYRLTMETGTPGAYILVGPHGATLSNYTELDNPNTAGAFVDISGIMPVDSNGAIDIKANLGNCTVTLTTFGYVI